MRLIELTDLYQPAIGGLERFVLLLSEGLASRGHEVHVVTSAVPGLAVVPATPDMFSYLSSPPYGTPDWAAVIHP